MSHPGADLVYSLAYGVAIVRPLTPRAQQWAASYFHAGNVERQHAGAYEVLRSRLPRLLRAAREKRLVISNDH